LTISRRSSESITLFYSNKIYYLERIEGGL
jgi:hypothetical protein